SPTPRARGSAPWIEADLLRLRVQPLSLGIDPSRPATYHRGRSRGMALPVRRLALMMPLTAALVGPVSADERPGPVTRTESFDRDPGWEGHNNRIVPRKYPTVVQDFGYSKTNVAGKAAGELGGQVWRASEPAFYAARIGPKTLD